MPGRDPIAAGFGSFVSLVGCSAGDGDLAPSGAPPRDAATISDAPSL
jgi:hypothetical protein